VSVHNEDLASLSELMVQSSPSSYELLNKGKPWVFTDEMNIFAPQSIESQYELEEIADLKLQIITPQSSSPIIAMKQDQLLGTYNLTSEYYKLDWRTTMNLLSSTQMESLDKVSKNKEYSGKEIFSYLIPKKINLLKGDPANPTILVKNGVMEAGILGDDALGVKKKNSLVQLVWDEYGVEKTRTFLDNTTKLANNFNMYHGMTVGVGDLHIPEELYKKLEQLFATKKLEIQHEITEFENNPDMMESDLFERTISQKLSVILSDVSKIVTNEYKPDNNFKIMWKSGAKGKDINLGQMAGCLGQVDFHGGRMLKNYNERALPYFFKNDDRAESRGFVERSFSKGLNLPEFIFHHLAAREGLIDQTVRSVTGDTRIMVFENNSSKIVEIGPWIDAYLTEATKNKPESIERDINNFELVKISNVIIPTVDENGKVTWGNVTAVTRHDPNRQLFEIVTRGGRKVIVPESKSLLVWNKESEKFEQKLTAEVSIGDFVPVTMNLIQPPTIINSIDMTKYFSKNEYIYGTDFIKAKELMENAMEGRDKIPIGWWEENNGKTFNLPYDKKARFQRALVRSNNDNVKAGYLYPFGSTKESVLIPEKFTLDKSNGQFIGLFLADGNIDIKSGYIQITKNNETVREFAKNWFKKFNIKTSEEIKEKSIGTSSQIRGYSTIMCKFITELVGHGSSKKHLPEIAFTAPEEFIVGLIDGYISGDGTIGENNIEASSASVELIEGINILLTRLGIFGKVFTTKHNDKEGDIKHNYDTTRLSIRGQFATVFKEKIALLNPEKASKLQIMEASKVHKNFIEQNDVILDKITEINEIPVSKYPKLYDLTVPSTSNFILANGLGVYDTAESGYVQRKLIKSTEDFMVNYDGTVRNAVGRIQQFIYGESGADTVKQYEFKFNIMEMSNPEVADKFKFTKEELKQLTKFSDADNEKLYKFYIDMRDKLRSTQMKSTNEYKTLTTNYMLPVNMSRIINNVKNNPDKKGSTNFDVEFILKLIDRILENKNTRLYCLSEEEMANPNSVKYRDDQMAKTALKYALYESIGPKKSIFVHKFSKEQLEEIAEEVITSFNKSIVEPGEMVGIIAAQSLGEPVTQLMLNAFHSSGVGGKGGTNIGVDRIKEVFSLSKNPKEPSMIIYLEKEFQGKKDFANKIASHIKFTTIKDLRSKIEIYYDPKPYSKGGFMEKDNINSIFYTYQQNKQCCSNSIDGLPWLMRIEFDKEKLLNKEVSLLDIKSQFCFSWEKRYQDIKSIKREKRQLLEKISQLAVLSNTDNDDVPTIHLRFDMTNFTSATLIDFMDMFVDEFKLKGMPFIEDIRGGGKASEERYISFDNPEKSMEKKTEYVVYTKGINMYDIRHIIGVDLKRTYCDDIITTYEIFGIEAARNLIIREIINVLTGNGSGTNYQHISMFGDLMTNVGTLTSIDRHGLNKLDTDPLARASFEKTVDQLITAAVFNEIDYMKSVSSRIMAGLCIKGGTGLCNLILDNDLLENSEYTIDIGQLYKKTYEDITIQQKQEVDTDVFIPDI
jgi:DNA-directed RNA polymerase beta' subunit